MTMIGFRDQEDWQTVYEVISISRAELQHELLVHTIDMLTDSDLHEIANRLATLLEERGSWEEAAIIARLVLAERE